MIVSTNGVAQEPHDIAIVGIGCRLPGGVEDPQALWKLLCDGVDAVGDIPADRWDPDRYFSAVEQTPGRMNSRRAGCLDRVDTFDAEFFGIVPRIAEQMDPQQRLLLETTWAAIEDAGIAPTKLAGSTTGTYMGACSHDYSDIQSAPTELAGLDAHSATGNFTSIVGNRLAYVLDLRGPSITVDTACSSSLVAVHLACSALGRGECDLAVAGGVNVMLSPHFPISLSQAAMLSPNGLSRAFDAAADGYVRGEGAGVVVLKRLPAALRDHDRVYAVIKGSAVNQDGRTPGITVPSEDSQRVNFLAAVRQAGVSAAEIGYVEAHGTGTPVGDPIEVTALGKVLNTDNGRGPNQRVLIGSIKTNIGHLEAGAGIAGLIKAALAVHHRAVPPSLHFSRPNPQIDFEKWRLAVPGKVEQWPDSYQRAVASVNSFGFGGTNANVVLTEAPMARRSPQESTNAVKPHLLTVSARSEPALATLAQAYADSWERSSDATDGISEVAAALARRRAHHDHRIAVIAPDLREAAASLRAHLETGRAPLVVQGQRKTGKARKLAFVFNGQGPQWWAMGRQLLEQEPVFRQAVEQCDSIAREFIEWSILAELLATEEESRVQRTFVLQPCIFAVQFGLVALWRSWGVEPDGVLGHSLGDISAACIAGIIDPRTALQIICHRSRIQDKADPEGGMLYATISPAQAERWCRRYPDELWLSAVNSQQAITFSGMRPVLAKVLDGLQAEGVFARILRVNCACHSPSMDPLRAELMECIGQIRVHEDSLPFYSTVTGRRQASPDISSEYFWDNFRQPVRFAAAMGAMLDDGYDLFVEISPHPVLLQAMRDVLAERDIDGAVLRSLKRGEDERRSLLGSLSALYVEGADLRWETRYPDPVKHVDLPLNPWQREPYWHESKVGAAARKSAQAHTIIQRVDAPLPTWETQWDDHRLAWVKDHHVFGGVVVPAAAYIEMAFSATAELTGRPCVLEHVYFERPCVLTAGEPAMTRIVLHPDSSSFEIHSRAVRDDSWTRHAKGRFRTPGYEPTAGNGRFDLDQILARCPETHSALAIYENMAGKGYNFGPRFSGIQRYHAGFGEALARVEPPLVLDRTGEYTIHPALLDSCLQSGVLVPAREDGSNELLQFTYLPTQAASLRFHAKLESGRPFWTYVKSHRADPAGFALDLYILSDAGEVLAEILGFTGNRVDDAETRRDQLDDHLYLHGWRDSPGIPASIERPPVIASGLASVRDEIEHVIPRLADELGRRSYHERYAPHVGELCTLYLIRCLRELGIQVDPGAELDQSMFARVLPEFRGWLRVSLDFLVRSGVLARRGDGFDVVALPGDGATSGTADLDALFSDLARTHAVCHPELMTLRRTGPALARVIRGEQDPLTLLFPAGGLDTTEALYHTAPIAHLYNIMARQAVQRIVELAGPERVVRILEIGAGTGGLTAHLLPILPAERTRYHFTDVSAAFLHSAREKFASYPFVTFGTLDLEQDPRDLGHATGEYDLVVASDAVHATADLATSLANIRRLLAPGGVVALIEVMPDNPWLHLTFGLTEGWWRFQDRDTRANGPLLPPATWLNLLRQGGFEEAASLSDVAEDSASGQFVLLARKPWPDDAASDNELQLAAGEVPQPTAELQPAAAEVDLDVDKVRDTAPAGNWLIFADQGGLGRGLAKIIRGRGGHCVLVRHSPAATFTQEDEHTVAPGDAAAIQEIIGDASWTGVVHLWNLDACAAEPDESRPAALDQAVITGSLSVAHIVSALARYHDTVTGKANLFVLTRGAQPVLTGDVSLAQAPVWGLALVCGLELPEVRCRMIDLSPARDGVDVSPARDGVDVSPARDGGEAEQVWEQLQRDDSEREVALRGADRLVGRLSRLPAQDRLGTELSPEILRRGDAFELQAISKGTLDRLVYVEKDRVPPGLGEVEIEVRAADLNFLDVMTALGQVPRRNEREQGLGGECAGVVTRVGDSVTGLVAGDEVIVVMGDQGAIASHVTVDARYVFRKPPAMSFEEACQLPIAFLTAWYALVKLAQVDKGDKVLIHSATGGTGLACVQVAQMLGAEVFATAGSDEKQDYLRALGVAHVMSSRSLDFADHIHTITDGHGVDVVINSLAGEAASRGIACLAPYGRFVEIGKRDFLTDANLHLRPFLDNLAYFSFDLRRMLADHPDKVRDEFLQLLDLFETGRLHALPHRLYPPAQVQQAFRNMVNAAHIGKLVISMRETPVKVSPRMSRRAVSAGGTWLLAGGLGGFGLRMAEHLARKGVRHLVLIGRTITEQARQRVHDIEHETSARIRLEAVDLCDRSGLRALIEDIEANMPPLKGVVHCAMVLDDRLITDLDEKAMLDVVHPKVLGAWHLHELTGGASLEAFVLFSSMTSMLGNQGQGNYAVANAFLDALAHHRKAKGLPATCVNWGVIADAGYVARQPGLRDQLAAIGAGGIESAEALNLLTDLIDGNHPQVGAFRIDWDRYARAVLRDGPDGQPRYAEIRVADQPHAARGPATNATLDERHRQTGEDLVEVLQAKLRGRLSTVLGLAPDKLDADLPLTAYLDSLLVTEIVVWIERELGATYTLMEIMKGPTVRQLAADLALRISSASDPHEPMRGSHR